DDVKETDRIKERGEKPVLRKFRAADGVADARQDDREPGGEPAEEKLPDAGGDLLVGARQKALPDLLTRKPIADRPAGARPPRRGPVGLADLGGRLRFFIIQHSFPLPPPT